MSVSHTFSRAGHAFRVAEKMDSTYASFFKFTSACELDDEKITINEVVIIENNFIVSPF